MKPHERITIAYPFKASELNDVELGVSIDSMLRFFIGSVRILVVGDKPRCRLPKHVEHVRDVFHPDPLEDAIRKIRRINSVVEGDRWIYCHDDMFALQPFSTFHLETVLYTYYRTYTSWNPHNRWARAKKFSMRLLGTDEVYDTATHHPRLFEKRKVDEVLEVGKKKPGLWDFQIVYDDLFTPPSKLQQVQESGRFLRISEPVESVAEAQDLCQGKMFLNTTTKAYNEPLDGYLRGYRSDVSRNRLASKAKRKPKTTSRPKPFQAERELAQKLPVYTKCVHRGKDTGETVKCGTCRALTSDQPIFECAVHGHATLRRPKKRHDTIETKDCVTCFAEQQGFEKKEEAHAVG